jgi:hypothetical protein
MRNRRRSVVLVAVFGVPTVLAAGYLTTRWAIGDGAAVAGDAAQQAVATEALQFLRAACDYSEALYPGARVIRVEPLDPDGAGTGYRTVIQLYHPFLIRGPRAVATPTEVDCAAQGGR